MKKLNLLLAFVALLTGVRAIAEDGVYVVDTNDHTVYVNNQAGNYFSIEFQKGDFAPTGGDNVYSLFGRHTQILSIPFDSEKYLLFDNPELEKELLYNFMKSETSYLKKSFGRSLELKKEMIHNINQKNFLVWSYRAKYKSKYDNEKLAMVLRHTGNGDMNFDNITHQVNLTFVSNKHIISIINPIFSGDDLDEEVEKLRKLTEQITTCAFPINVQLLLHKTYAKELGTDYELKDENAGVTIPLPEWLDFYQYPDKNSLMAGFTEKRGITDLIMVNWEPKRPKRSFVTFIEESLADSSITSKELSNDAPLSDGVFYDVERNNYFKCKYVFLEGKQAYFKMVYLASPETFAHNLPWLNNFITDIQIN